MSLPGNEGYKYFGAAKNLPKVREILEQQEQLNWQPPKSNLKELESRVNHFYLGHCTPDDQTMVDLEAQEAELERELRSDKLAQTFIDKYVAKKRRRIELMQTQDKEVRFSSLNLD